MGANPVALGLELVDTQQLAEELLKRSGAGVVLLAGLPPGTGPMIALGPGQMPVFWGHKGHPVALLKLANQFEAQMLNTFKVETPPALG